MNFNSIYKLCRKIVRFPSASFVLFFSCKLCLYTFQAHQLIFITISLQSFFKLDGEKRITNKNIHIYAGFYILCSYPYQCYFFKWILVTVSALSFQPEGLLLVFLEGQIHEQQPLLSYQLSCNVFISPFIYLFFFFSDPGHCFSFLFCFLR